MRGRTNVTQRAVPYVNGEVITAEASESINVGDFVDYVKQEDFQYVDGYVTSQYQNIIKFKIEEDIYLYQNVNKLDLVSIKNGFEILSSITCKNFCILKNGKILVYVDYNNYKNTFYLYEIKDYKFNYLKNLELVLNYSDLYFCELTGGHIVFLYNYKARIYSFIDEEFELICEENSITPQNSSSYTYERMDNFIFKGKNNCFGYFTRYTSNNYPCYIYYFKYNQEEGTIEKKDTKYIGGYTNFTRCDFVYSEDYFAFQDPYFYKSSGAIPSEIRYKVYKILEEEVVEFDQIDFKQTMVELFGFTTQDVYKQYVLRTNLKMSGSFIDLNKFLFTISDCDSVGNNVGDKAINYRCYAIICGFDNNTGFTYKSNPVLIECPEDIYPAKYSSVVSNYSLTNYPFAGGYGFCNSKNEIFYIMNNETYKHMLNMKYSNGKLIIGENTEYVEKYKGQGVLGFAKTSANKNEEIKIYIPKTT